MRKLRNGMILAYGKDGGKEGRKKEFTATAAAKVVLVSTLAAGAATCTPDITINNIPYDPNAVDGGAATGGECIASCEVKSGILREAGNSAGPNTLAVGNATLTFEGIDNNDITKPGKFRLDGCGQTARASINAGAEATMTLKDESADVKVDEMSYDAAGLRVRVTVTPLCPGPEQDAGGGGDGGTSGDGGSGGNGGSD